MVLDKGLFGLVLRSENAVLADAFAEALADVVVLFPGVLSVIPSSSLYAGTMKLRPEGALSIIKRGSF